MQTSKAFDASSATAPQAHGAPAPTRRLRQRTALMGLLLAACGALAVVHSADWHQVRIVADARGTCVRANPQVDGPCSAGQGGNVMHYLPAGQTAHGTVSAAWWGDGYPWLWVRWQSANAPSAGWVRADVVELARP